MQVNSAMPGRGRLCLGLSATKKDLYVPFLVFFPFFLAGADFPNNQRSNEMPAKR
jgi:hypothetical protein